MKISCETGLIYRSKPELKNRFVTSSLAIIRNCKESPKIFIHLFQNPNKRLLKYVVEDNIHGIHAKFFNEGKCTLCFSYPEHDLQIRAGKNSMKHQTKT
jgi:hexokinase